MKIKKIKIKILFSYAIILVLLLGLGWYMTESVSNVNENGKKMYHNRLIPITNLTKIAEYSGNIRVQMVTALLRQDSSLTEQALSNLKNIDEEIKKYGNRYLTEEEKAVFEEFTSNWQTFHDRVQKNAALMKSGNFAAADDGIKIGGQSYTAAIENLNQLIEINEEIAHTLLNNNESTYNSIRTTLTICILGFIAISILIAFTIGNSIANSINSILSRVKMISEGNLTGGEVTVKSHDEIAQLADGINMMQHYLRALVMSTKETSSIITASANELSASVEQSTLATEEVATLSQNSAIGADRQLQSITEVSSSIEQLAASMQQIALSTDGMLEMSQKTNQATSCGSQTVYNISQQMSVISEIVNKLSVLIKNLSKKSQEIGNITAIITNISEQTNLLALNAAIEAARAGEHGKGFAVVADEVRKLAEESKLSAKQITDTLTEIQVDTSNAVRYMNDGTEKVSEGIVLSNEINKAFSDIQKLISYVSSTVQNVSASIREMATVSEHIVHNSEQVKEIAEATVMASQDSSAATEEQLATMEEISSSAQSLASVAEELQTVVSEFRV